MAGKSSGSGRYCYSEVLPFVGMVIVECVTVGNSTLFKVASATGMSYTAFVAYSFAVSALCLVPLAFFFHRKTRLPPLSFQFLWRICLLAVIGLAAQMLGYKGIEYSTPTMASAMSSLTPAFTFALAIIFRMEKVVLRSLHSQAKIIGTVVSISGAFVVILYEGPAVIGTSYSSSSSSSHPNQSPNWLMGGLLLVVDYFLVSIWYIVQARTARIYPAEFFVVCFYNFCVTLFAVPVCFFMEPDTKAWQINSQIMLLAILFTGIASSGFGVVINTWSLRVKGPVYVASFRPLSIAIAAITGVIFLGDTLFLGSVIGAVMISIGFYVVLWGKAQEEMIDEDRRIGSSIESPAAEHVPLLQ